MDGLPESLGATAEPVSRDEFWSLAPAELIGRYERGVNRLDPRLLRLDDEQLDTFFLPEAGVGRWSCRVLMGHLVDVEIALTHRMRRIIGEENPMLAMWDEESFIDSGIYAPGDPPATLPPAACVATIHTIRQWSAPWLRALSPDAWSRRGLHPEEGEQTFHHQAAKVAWHLEHHGWFLARKVEKLSLAGS